MSNMYEEAKRIAKAKILRDAADSGMDYAITAAQTAVEDCDAVFREQGVDPTTLPSRQGIVAAIEEARDALPH